MNAIYKIIILLITPFYLIAQDITNSKEKEDSNSYKHAISFFNLGQILSGIATLTYEQKVTKNISMEFGLGYIWYIAYTSETGNQTSLPNHKFVQTKGFNPTTGIKLFEPYNHKGYIEALLSYKYLMALDTMKIEYDNLEKNEGDICARCNVIETETRNVISPKILIGFQSNMENRFYYNLYLGAGVNLKWINSYLYEIFDNNTNIKFIYDKFKLKRFEKGLAINSGVKFCFAF